MQHSMLQRGRSESFEVRRMRGKLLEKYYLSWPLENSSNLLLLLLFLVEQLSLFLCTVFPAH